MSTLTVSEPLSSRIARHTVSSKDNFQTWYVRQPHTLVLWAEVIFPQVKILKTADYVLHNFDKLFSFPKLYETVLNFTKGFSQASTAKKVHFIADRSLLIAESIKSIFKLGKTFLADGSMKRVIVTSLPVLSVLGAVFLLYHNGSKLFLKSKTFFEKDHATQEDRDQYYAAVAVCVSKFAIGILSCISLYYGGNYFYQFLYIKTAIGMSVTYADILKVKYNQK